MKKTFDFYTFCFFVIASALVFFGTFFSIKSYAQQAPSPVSASGGKPTPVIPSPMADANSSMLPTAPTAVLGGPAFVSAPSSPAPQRVAAPVQNNETDPAVLQMARDQAFNQLALNTLPMTPDQVQKLRNLFADSQRAATVSPGGAPPKAVASTQQVSLEPGSTPPLIRLSQGYITTIMFLDSTSAPWPIQAYDIGNPGAFNIQWDAHSNVMMIQSIAMYTTSNLVIQLKGLNTPITISLIPGQPIVDYRVDLRVQGFGPNAKPSAVNALPDAAGNDLIHVLDGLAPSDKAKPLKVQDTNALAWLLGDKMYLRTHLTLLSPAWIASMASADGTNAYEIPKTPSILVSNSDGKIYNLRIEGY